MAEAKKPAAKKKAEPKKKAAPKKPSLISLADALDILDSKPDAKVSRECWPDSMYLYKERSNYWIHSMERGREVLPQFPREMIESDYYEV